MPMQRDFNQLETAMAVRDSVDRIATAALKRERPSATYATVESWDDATRVARVVPVGQEGSVPVPYATIGPSALGQLVRVGGVPGDRYIEAVVGGGASVLAANMIASETVTATRLLGRSASEATTATPTSPFEVGPEDGPLVRMGPSTVQAVGVASSAASLRLNPDGGNVLVNQLPLVPLLNTASAMIGTPPAHTAPGTGFRMEAGYNFVPVSAGLGIIFMPTPFPNGLLAFVASSWNNADTVVTATGTVTLASVEVAVKVAGADGSGSYGISWIAIGW